jgi:serine/threonine protein kinase
MGAELVACELLTSDDTDQKWRSYIPTLIDRLVGADGRQANVFKRLERHFTLEQVRQQHPEGVPFINTVWIWRRLLAVLAFAHDNHFVHGAVLPTSVFIDPVQRGDDRLVLADWHCSQDIPFGPIEAIETGWRDWYPDEALSGHDVSPATDIFMAAQTFIYLLGGDPKGELPDSVPTEVQQFFRNCLQPQSTRPQDAGRLQQSFDDLLKRMGEPYYPRKFRPFPFQPN